MHVRTWSRIDEVPRDAWDEGAGGELALGHAWQRLIEAGSTGYRAEYLLCSDEKGPAAVLVAPRWKEGLAARVVLGRAFRASAPWSASAGGLSLRRGLPLESAWDPLWAALRSRLLRRGQAVFVTALAGGEAAAFLRGKGFSLVEVEGEARVETLGRTHAQFLADLNQRRRNEIARAGKRAAAAGVTVERTGALRENADDVLRLLEGTAARHGDANPFTARVFPAAAEIFGAGACLYTARQGGALRAAALSIDDGRKVLNPIGTADHAARETYAYLAMLDQVVRDGFERRVEVIHLGLTNQKIKQRHGATVAPRYVAYRGLLPGLQRGIDAVVALAQRRSRRRQAEPEDREAPAEDQAAV